MRDRPKDIAPLAEEFFRTRSLDKDGALAKAPLRLSLEALRTLEAQRWAGNVRELFAVLARVVIDHPHINPGSSIVDESGVRSAIDGGDLSPVGRGLSIATERSSVAALPLEELLGGRGLKVTLRAFENRLIEGALHEAGGVVAHAAELLGIGRTTLVDKMKRKGIE